MDLKTAIDVVYRDTRAENPDRAGSAREAVQFNRGCLDHAEVDFSIDDPRLNEAYHVVLNATDAEIAQALK